MTANPVLDATLDPNSDAGPVTVRAYLGELLITLWLEKEQFSGKRPFGNSGWEHDLYVALVRAKLVDGRIDEDGYVIDVDEDKADALIADAIADGLGLRSL